MRDREEREKNSMMSVEFQKCTSNRISGRLNYVLPSTRDALKRMPYSKITRNSYTRLVELVYEDAHSLAINLP